MALSKIQRRDEILKTLYEQGHVEVRHIAQRLGTSEATARRDLRGLADEGVVDLVYGGATVPRTGNYTLQSRQRRNIDAKRAIGRLAADLVRSGDSLFIDSGTTCGAMVPHLLVRHDLTVITNCNLVAAQLGEHSDSNIIQLGGKFRFERMDSVGPLAQAAIERLSGFHAFVGADGLGFGVGLTSTDVDTASLYRTVIEQAAQSTLLVDHTKFSAPALHKIIDVGTVDRIVTDRPPPDGWAVALGRAGVEVIVPEITEEDTEA
jgi:DeoR/GlpR family transcriptional regulator of sugar metabolism